MSRFEVQAPLDFLKSFNSYAKKAKRSIWIQSMNLDPGENVNTFVDSLINAAKRGLDVRVNVDWLAEKFYEGRFDTLPMLNIRRSYAVANFNKERQKTYAALKAAGVKVTVTNQPTFLTSFFPVYRRNHIKM